MVNSKWEYVKDFEINDSIIPNVYIVIRIDGRGFTKFCIEHNLKKPIDDRMVKLMTSCGISIMNNYFDIFLGFGESDEFSFIFKKNTNTFNRRQQKLISTLTSLFTATFILNWSKFFINEPLKLIPTFDGRLIIYPKLKMIKDYLSWRQADTHINALYNYTLCSLLNKGIDSTIATEMLRGTFSNDKYQILLENGIDYNKLPLSHIKGIVLIKKKKILETNEDLISDNFWLQNKKYFK